MTTLDQEVNKLVEEFSLSDETLNKIVEVFVAEGAAGLNHDSVRGLPMIPTYILGVPTGKEKGTFLAADLGGTNFRVCSVELNGDSTFSIRQEKWAVPVSIMTGKGVDFMDFMADRVEEFLHLHHQECFTRDPNDDDFRMGFTFSFPVKQTGINRGLLLRWTKGFAIDDLVGKDVCEQFQAAIDRRKLGVNVAALINDTVGALLARAYSKGGDAQTMIGTILGTGTNAAYSEKISNISKFNVVAHPVKSKIMLVNTEWGSFDNDLAILPNTRFDTELNRETPNPNFHMFEKRVSGMFLGELLRLVLVELHAKGAIFNSSKPSEALKTPWSTDTSIPSNIERDHTSDLVETGKILKDKFSVETTFEERKAVQILSHAIAKRAAGLVASALAGLLKLTKGLEKFKSVDIGGDGSIFEHYPDFEKHLREALRKTFVGEDEKRISIGMAKDGSGVGAALCAAMTLVHS